MINILLKPWIQSHDGRTGWRVQCTSKKLDGVAPLVREPPCTSSAARQNPQFCNPPLYIALTSEPIMQVPNPFVYRISGEKDWPFQGQWPTFYSYIIIGPGVDRAATANIAKVLFFWDFRIQNNKKGFGNHRDGNMNMFFLFIMVRDKFLLLVWLNTQPIAEGEL